MKPKEELTAGEILDAADDGRVLLMNRETYLLMQIQDDKRKGLIKRAGLIVQTRRDLAKAKKNNPSVVPELEKQLMKLKKEQHEELRFET